MSTSSHHFTSYACQAEAATKAGHTPAASQACRKRRVTGFVYFFFFDDRDGITLATAVTTPDAIFATTPFFGLRFAFEVPGRLPLLFEAGLDFDFAFGLVFVAFFAIANSSTARFVS
jgi:hypothetical protein